MSIEMIVGDGSLWLAVAIAALAGLISFLSPCVLPLVPGYLGYIGGAIASSAPQGRRQLTTARGPGLSPSVEDEARSGDAPIPRTAELHDGPRRSRLLTGVLLFIAGFTVVFMGVAMLGGTIGRFLIAYGDVLTRLLGLAIIALGLVFVGAFKFAQRAVRPRLRSDLGLVGAPLLGVALGIGWTPCIGPTLAVILGMSLDAASASRGAVLGLAYSLGLGIPFILVSLGFQWASQSLTLIRRHMRVVNLVGGGVLIALGILMVAGVWTALMSQLQGVFQTVPLPI